MPTDSSGNGPMSTQPRPRVTPEEYLAAERRAETKSEYYAGEVFALAGASRDHNRIVIALIGALYRELGHRPCEIFGGDMRVKVSSTGLYTYPDVAVVCGEPHFEDRHLDTLVDPALLVEVLSASTEAYDRGRKAEQYRRLVSLGEYLLIAQDALRVERYRRQGEREWLLTEFRDLEDEVELESVGCSLRLGEIYARAPGGR